MSDVCTYVWVTCGIWCSDEEICWRRGLHALVWEKRRRRRIGGRRGGRKDICGGGGMEERSGRWMGNEGEG